MGALDFGRGSALPPLALLSQALPRLTRSELEGVVELLIDRLDEVDGDADIEPDGDELDGTGGDDDFGQHGNWLLGPGCPYADPGEDGGDTEPTNAGRVEAFPVFDNATRELVGMIAGPNFNGDAPRYQSG